ncbi:MAG: UDP-N-acetylmuramoyl-L-alanyl-D-glutamate--2,6-diaminopimelate ligase [Phycisphaerales bacterium]|nr:UDP-N-acetylmuramoyl-L-alanyl-D-glutamate--2,6-diaminopimelate ligase [Phycisphaerales bacterium]
MHSVPILQLLNGLSLKPSGLSADCTAVRLVEDSRCISQGDVFYARQGEKSDGRSYIKHAESAGAVAVLSDAEGCAMASGPTLLSADLPRDSAILAHRLQGDPSEQLDVIGVTGTNGKTTVSTLLQQLLSTHAPCGLLGGIVRDDGIKSTEVSLTTPMACEVAEWLGSCRDHGCGSAVMEVSSHALDLGRVDGVRYSAAIFTNLSGDHLDHHGTMEAYFECKRRLFLELDPAAVCITNIDDPRGKKIVEDSDASVLTCSLDQTADVVGAVHASDSACMEMSIESPWGSWRQTLPFVGTHNAMNALQAIAAACVAGGEPEVVASSLEQATSPLGRMQCVSNNPWVMVDFAHTDAALKAVLSAVRQVLPADGRLHVVIGCGGDRDHSKRPRMAKTACEYAGEVWLTSDNPRSESPASIIADMQAGIPASTQAIVHVREDRAAAIHDAIARAKPEDCVVIAGKGHEQIQIFATEVIPFDDVAVARQALQDSMA